MEGDVEFRASIGSDDKSKELKDLLDEIAEMTDHITIVEKELKRTPSFQVSKPEEDTGITFAGIPLGHEFNSLCACHFTSKWSSPKENNQSLIKLKVLKVTHNFETYVSLTCQNVQM